MRAEDIGPALRAALSAVSEGCINCELCQKECAFLRKYGKPKEIANSFEPTNRTCQGMAFECSLCQLCAAICPVGVNPAELFLEMRRQAVQWGVSFSREHAALLAYERRGMSRLYAYCAIPEQCDTVFFPGCALSGTRPHKVFLLFQHLRRSISSLGVILDCCGKPSHDLGRQEHFTAAFTEMKGFLLKHDVRHVLLACPNCYKVFKDYGSGLFVKTVYEILAEVELPETPTVSATVRIHDPCPVRFEGALQSAARDIAIRKGLTLVEMPHEKETTLCCGEGGAVGCLCPELANTWTLLRREEAQGDRVLTYCAGCATMLGRSAPASHLVDLIFEPDATMSGKSSVSRPPFTYLNRLRLKRRFEDAIVARVTRENR